MNNQNLRNLYAINNYTMGEKIRYLREQQKLSLEKLAKEIGVAKGTLSEIENDKRFGNLSTVIDLANYFDVSIDWLCSRSKISDTDYNLNYVCDYTGLSANAIKAFQKYKESKKYSDTDKDNDDDISKAKNNLLDEFITSGELFDIIDTMKKYCSCFDFEFLSLDIETYQWRYDIARKKGLKVQFVDDNQFLENEKEEEKDHRTILLFKIQETAKSFIFEYTYDLQQKYNIMLNKFEEIIQKCRDHNKNNPNAQSLIDWQISNIDYQEGESHGNDQETE